MMPIASPHTHAPASVRRVMLEVLLALLPATAFAVYQFGWPALYLLIITSAFALFGEALSLRLAGRPVGSSLNDGSALLTAWLLALSLPPWAPWWIGAIGGLFAIVVGKQVFGGIGQNIFNPAMLARVALLISFPLEMTLWTPPQPLFSATAPGPIDALAITFGGGAAMIDAISGASLLGHVKTELGRGLELGAALQGQPITDSLYGTARGSLGEGSAPLLLIGGIYLIARGIIGWAIPLAVIAGALLPALLLNLIDPEHYLGPLHHLFSGALLLSAFFIATDPVGSPATPRGRILFGAGIGLLIYIIRTWGGFPEGAAFAVLLMNSATPLIDHYLRPRIYGRERGGEPLDYSQGRRAARLERIRRGDK